MSGKLCQILAVKESMKNTPVKLFGVCVDGCAIRALLALFFLVIGGLSLPGYAESEEVQDNAGISASPLSDDIETLKKSALELNRDLLILEEELLFPANTQIMVYLSLDTGEFFRLDAVKLHIDDKLIASHLYTPRQNDALRRGGIQRLYIGNLKTGDHELTAYFTGIGPDKREYKRGTTVTVSKDDDPKMLELKVMDSSANMQPEFVIKEWQL